VACTQNSLTGSSCADYIVTRTVLRSIAILSLMSCLSPGPLIPSSAHAQGVVTKPNKASPVINMDDLLQHWVHSSEEDQSGEAVQTYRPAESVQFPPSRFRMAYKFASGGDCEFYFLSPDDNHHFRACHWNIWASDKTILRIVGDGKARSFEIVELSGKVLRLRPLE
jgi:hypothetical protein